MKNDLRKYAAIREAQDSWPYHVKTWWIFGWGYHERLVEMHMSLSPYYWQRVFLTNLWIRRNRKDIQSKSL